MHNPTDPSSSRNPPLFRVGVDVGGTKVAAGAVDDSGCIHGRVQVKTDATNPETALESIANAITSAIDCSGFPLASFTGVGLGVPGHIDPIRGTATLSINLGWRNTPIRTALETCIGLPCFIDNDVKAATLGEWRYGAGRGTENLVYLSIGTGIGAGIVIDGKLRRGAHLIAGEVGQAIVDMRGPRCKCGSEGCLEVLASGSALTARVMRGIEAGRPTVLKRPEQDGSDWAPAREVGAAAAAGDPFAKEVLEDMAFHLAFAIRWLVTSIDPELIILGGGVVEAGEPLLVAIRQELQRQADESWVFHDMYRPETIRLSILKKDAGILGAAALVPS